MQFNCKFLWQVMLDARITQGTGAMHIDLKFSALQE
jgi:hypothetical protein